MLSELTLVDATAPGSSLYPGCAQGETAEEDSNQVVLYTTFVCASYVFSHYRLNDIVDD